MKIKIKIIISGVLLATMLFTEPAVSVTASDEDKTESRFFLEKNMETVDNLSHAQQSTEISTQEKSVILYQQDGSVYKILKIRKDRVKLPSMANPKGYTFMGWSKTSGKKAAPDYEAGDTIVTSEGLKLYPVMFDRSEEPDVSKREIAIPKGYQYIIFVGDSRTYAMERLLKREFGSSAFKKVKFISKPGTTLKWLKSTGSEKLFALLHKNKRKDQYPKTAVIFNHGVNDLKHNNGKINVNTLINRYCSYMRTLGPQLKQMNCDLYYMSVNPINTGRKNETTLRKGEEVRKFNKGIRKGLKGMYGFIDTYSYLIKNGYGTAHNLNAQQKDDGTHYTYKSYKRIFAYCMKQLAKKKKR